MQVPTNRLNCTTCFFQDPPTAEAYLLCTWFGGASRFSLCFRVSQEFGGAGEIRRGCPGGTRRGRGGGGDFSGGGAGEISVRAPGGGSGIKTPQFGNRFF